MRIISITKVKPEIVYAIETSSHTYIADGLYHHNCRACNGFGNGKYAEYSLWFIDRYGLEEWEKKVKLSNTTIKYTKEDYKEMYEDYKKRLDDMCKPRKEKE